ncbi:hypothetical protein LguiA_012140 [Lonicera macranthoides]
MILPEIRSKNHKNGEIDLKSHHYQIQHTATASRKSPRTEPREQVKGKKSRAWGSIFLCGCCYFFPQLNKKSYYFL